MTYEIRLCNLTKFENYSKSYTSILTGGKQNNIQKATFKLYDDRITIIKAGMFTKLDKRTKTVLFQDVTGLDCEALYTRKVQYNIVP